MKALRRDLDPMTQLRAGALPRRLAQLAVGLTLYGASMALVLSAGLGTMPWDVFHVGIAQHTGAGLGSVVIVTSLAVLLAWIPLRQTPGLGTILNSVWLGLVLDRTLPPLTTPEGLGGRAAMLAAGVVANALATALYLGAQLGPGPRDGLMTGLAHRTGSSIRLVRTVMEIVLVGFGWLLGGALGVGTVAYALAIGPLTQLFLPRCICPLPAAPGLGGVGSPAVAEPSGACSQPTVTACSG